LPFHRPFRSYENPAMAAELQKRYWQGALDLLRAAGTNKYR
jgi:hypothetical protein